MEVAATSAAVLFALAFLLKGLRHYFYLIHLLVVAGLSWLCQRYMINPPEMFSHDAFRLTLMLHLIVINIITFWAYAHDKRASMEGSWRVPERTLQAFALIGGVPGAWSAQRKFRHKTRKASFQFMFWCIALLQAIAIAVLYHNA